MNSNEQQKQDYFKQAFIRNKGLVNEEQQLALINKSVGIAGLGGVGGSYALGFARAGVGRLILSDFDRFEVVNMNRQAGAMSSTLGVSKVDAIVKMVKDINPYIEIEVFSDGIHDKNVSSFVQKSDVIVDAIDFYCIETHRLLHKTCREQGKRALFSVPFGSSATLQIFDPHNMSFEEYYDFKSCNDFMDKMSAFAVGCAPKATQWSYMKVTGQNLAEGSPPSLVSAIHLSAGVVINSALLLLTGAENEVKFAPHYIQFDARKMKLKKGSLKFGNRGILQQLKRWVLAKRFADWREKINQMGAQKGGAAPASV